MKANFVSAVLVAMIACCGGADAAFYVNCAGCHLVPQKGMDIVNYQATTNPGTGWGKVFEVNPGQTAVIQLDVTNSYGGAYALNINNLAARGINNTNNQLAGTPDPAWTSYFPATATNFFMAGPATASPQVWTFNLGVNSNTPADFYMIKAQMAGVYSSTMWSQQEFLYLQVTAASPPMPALLSPRWSANSFSLQVATTSGYTYYLEGTTNLAPAMWTVITQAAGDGASETLTDPAATPSHAFYRVRAQ